MIRELIVSIIASLTISQAQAMVDPNDDDGMPSSTSTARQPRTNTDRNSDPAPAAPTHAPNTSQRNDASSPQQDESKTLREQNAALQEQIADLEARLAALDRLDNVEISEPQNIVHWSRNNQANEDSEDDISNLDISDLVDAETGLPYNPDDFSYPQDGPCQT